MSRYTTELRFICESVAGYDESKGYADVNSIITQAAPHIFDFDFPIFDENYRLPLERKILRHYYTREIGSETYGLWKLRLEDKLNIIMPYYNKLYSSELLQFNPLYDIDITRTKEGTDTGLEETSGRTTGTESGTDVLEKTDTTGTETSKSVNATETEDTTISRDKDSTNTETKNLRIVEDNEYARNEDSTSTHTAQETIAKTTTDLAWDLYSDTPQGGINGIEGDGDGVHSNTYLTNARKNTDSKNENTTRNLTENGTNNIDEDGTEDKIKTESGTDTFVLDETETNDIDGSKTSTINESGTLDSTVSVNESRETSRTNTGTNTGTKNITNTQEYLEHVQGKNGGVSYSKMLMEYRETFMNIDKMVINELSDLFLKLWI